LDTMLYEEIDKDLTSHGAQTKLSSGMNSEARTLSANNWANIETATGGRNKNA
jgi:hypothetical protein